MRVLLDSHVLLWWLEDNEALGPKTRELITSADEVFVSAVTPWELGIKRALGKLSMPDDMNEVVAASGFLSLPISQSHGALAPTLAPHHRDPFDRMLVAQAQLESLTLVSADSSLADYAVEQFSARS